MKYKFIFNDKKEQTIKETNKIEQQKASYEVPLTRVKRRKEPVSSRLRKSDSFR